MAKERNKGEESHHLFFMELKVLEIDTIKTI
jgi:hypothetical protein